MERHRIFEKEVHPTMTQETMRGQLHALGISPGDVLFVPSGSRVIWGSPDKARIFYATYPANWADLT